jgi:hypothetical protein
MVVFDIDDDVLDMVLFNVDGVLDLVLFDVDDDVGFNSVEINVDDDGGLDLLMFDGDKDIVDAMVLVVDNDAVLFKKKKQDIFVLKENNATKSLQFPIPQFESMLRRRLHAINK